MYSGELGECLGNIFLWFLWGKITAGYKNIKSINTVFVRDGGECGSGNGSDWVLKVWKEGEGNQNWKSANKRGGRSKFWVFCDDIIIECPPTQKFITKPQFMSMSCYDLHLVHIKSQ